MMKKTQIFLFDLIFAFVIFIVSITLFYTYYINVDENVNVYDLNINIINSFTNTKLNDLNDKEIRDLFIQNKIRNIENTVAEQVVEFYEANKSNPVEAQYLSKIYVKDYIDKQMNFEFTLENETDVLTTLYRYPELPDDYKVSFENSTIATRSQRLIFGFKNQTEFYGPYLLKVKIWI